MFIDSVINADGQVQAVSTGTAVSFCGGQGYIDGTVMVTTEAPAATDGVVSGINRTAAGNMRIVDASLGNPAGTVKLGGFAVSPDGQLCIDTNAVSSPVFIGKVAVNSDGAAFMAVT